MTSQLPKLSDLPITHYNNPQPEHLDFDSYEPNKV